MSVRATTVKKVVIIGAGLAGLAAAHKLSTAVSKNVTFDVKLLEAKPYPGGRAHSVQWSNGKYTTELGAHFLYCFESATNLTDLLSKQELIELIPRARAHFSSGTWYRCTEVALWKKTAIAVLNIKQHKTH